MSPADRRTAVWDPSTARSRVRSWPNVSRFTWMPCCSPRRPSLKRPRVCGDRRAPALGAGLLAIPRSSISTIRSSSAHPPAMEEMAHGTIGRLMYPIPPNAVSTRHIYLGNTCEYPVTEQFPKYRERSPARSPIDPQSATRHISRGACAGARCETAVTAVRVRNAHNARKRRRYFRTAAVSSPSVVLVSVYWQAQW